MKRGLVKVERIWSSAADTCTTLLRKGVDITLAVSALRDLRSLINQYGTDGSNDPRYEMETLARINRELRNVEDMIVIKAANELGIDYANDLSARLTQAWVPEKMIVKEVRRK